jgi:sulfonate transport system permease protein
MLRAQPYGAQSSRGQPVEAQAQPAGPASAQAAGAAIDVGQARSAGAAAGWARPRRRRRRLAPGKRIPYGRLLGPVLIFGLWSLGSATHVIDPSIVSAPWSVIATAGALLARGELQSDFLVSARRALIGLGIGVLVGTGLAVIAGMNRIGDAVVDGAMQVKRAIPALALIPLMILWLGIGEEMKIVTIALFVLVPVYINTYAALTSIDSRYVELAEVVGLSRLQFIRKIVIPGALPGWIVGLRLGVTASWLALIVVEQINATSGIGYMMFQAQQYGQISVILVGLAVYGLFGFVTDSVVRLIERRALAWRRTLAG